MTAKDIAIIGGGPAGLMAAEVLSASSHRVTLYEAMPTVGRKFLLAGKSGLNLTHSEDFARFAARFGAASERLRPALDAFTPDDLRTWADELGAKTFTGTSGRVFPEAMKASPLLRAWLARLEARGVTILRRHRWIGFDGNAYVFDTPDGRKTIRPDATLLALGGASWPRLGSDAAWLPWLQAKGVDIRDFRPANSGFDIAWSDIFRERFAGAPVKSVTATSPAGTMQGEFVISKHGIEGSLVYAHSASLRDQLAAHNRAELILDLLPGRGEDRLARDLARQSTRESFSNRLRKGAGLDGVKTALLREVGTMGDPGALSNPARLARLIKTLPIPLLRPRPITEAISSAGGIAWNALDENYMLTALAGTFAAGEMLDWEAPTGGYLLTACFATGRAAAHGLQTWLAQKI
jgi:hypothetical protein